MTTAALTERISEPSQHFKSTIAKSTTTKSVITKSTMTGIFYLITVLTGGAVLLAQGRLGLGFDLIAAAFYVAVTVLFYRLSRLKDSRIFTKSSQRS
jgi:hypothetical protein